MEQKISLVKRDSNRLGTIQRTYRLNPRLTAGSASISYVKLLPLTCGEGRSEGEIE